MRKRTICLCLCAVFLLGMFAFPASAADTVLTINPPGTLPKAGQSFTVTVELSGNPGLTAVQFTLGFDTGAMSCTKAKIGEALSGTLSATNPSAPLGAAIAAASVDPISNDGTVASFSFTAIRDLTEMSFTLQEVLLSDAAGNSVSFTVTGGTLIQPASGTTQTTPGSTPTTPGVTPTAPGDTPTDPDKPATGREVIDPGAEETPDYVDTDLFEDTRTHWASEYIRKAVARGLFKGYSDGTFRPDVNVSRVQFVTVLYRMAGSPEVADKSTPFTDIAGQSEEFQTAIAWGYHNGYLNGTSETTFSPAASLTREAAMKILFFYAGGQSGMELMFTETYDAAFKDSGSISSWAKAPLYWGVYNAIISGTSKDTLSPQGTATRAQLAKILVGYLEKMEGTKE